MKIILLKGIIKQTISCKCGRKSVRELPFNPFYLGIDKVKSLSKAIENYFSAEEWVFYLLNINPESSKLKLN